MHHPRPRLLLLDFDGLLVHYSHGARLLHLARSCGVEAAQVAEAVFASGLEAAHDSGSLDTASYLRRIGEALGSRLDEAPWIQARVASCRVQPQVVELVRQLDGQVAVGILSNNGGLLPEVVRQVLPTLHPRLHGRVLCSAALQARKPHPGIFAAALAHCGTEARHALFVDDLFVNVRGARAAGLHAETARDAQTLRKVFKRYGLL
ncbi:HAD-IA family hydrolase [Pseudoxanthomonas sp. J35]|uniref:HAD-IA family hydrolase n=1 Tax=Pseudoxanthomonas sp. J35 TaxID=935852 RepID=UPI000491B276|nr:HAD-IA family hydrolase [Pseudoxanthomonas sp. J35]